MGMLEDFRGIKQDFKESVTMPSLRVGTKKVLWLSLAAFIPLIPAFLSTYMAIGQIGVYGNIVYEEQTVLVRDLATQYGIATALLINAPYIFLIMAFWFLLPRILSIEIKELALLGDIPLLGVCSHVHFEDSLHDISVLPVEYQSVPFAVFILSVIAWLVLTLFYIRFQWNNLRLRFEEK